MTKIGKVLFATAFSACFSLSAMSADNGSIAGLHADQDMIDDIQSAGGNPAAELGLSEEQVAAVENGDAQINWSYQSDDQADD